MHDPDEERALGLVSDVHANWADRADRCFIRHGVIYPWGCFIRAAPHSLELLQDICQVSLDPNALKMSQTSLENYHDTLQWLKVSNCTMMYLVSSALIRCSGISGPSTGCDRGVGAISRCCDRDL
jgi:hypothetical protein